MSRMKDFLTCRGCYECLAEYYENNELDIESEGEWSLSYKCPICGYKNKYNTMKHNHED